MAFLDKEFDLPSDIEEYQDLECPHCREIMLTDDDFLNHVCKDDPLDDVLLMEDII